MTPTVKHQQGSFVHRGHRLHYEIYGEGHRLVVYMHGLLLDADLNRRIAEALAERGNRVVLLDLLGHGRSDKPDHASEYRMDLYVTQVVACLDHLGVDEAVLGGVSLGANVSLLAAAYDSERVRGLILEMPVLERATPAVALTFVPLMLAVHYARRPVAAASRFIGRLPRTPFSAFNSVMNALSLGPDVVAAILHGILVGPVGPTFQERRQIAVPTLVIGHGRDFIHPWTDAEALARILPLGRLTRASSVIELRVKPRRLTAEIVRFLDEVWGDEDAGSAISA